MGLCPQQVCSSVRLQNMQIHIFTAQYIYILVQYNRNLKP